QQLDALRPTWKAGCSFVILALLASATAQQSASEYQVKAAYLYNFAKMSQWPAQSLPDENSALIIGVYGGDEDFVNVLRATLAGKAINGHPLEIRHLQSAEDLKYCHLVSFRSSERAIPSMIAALGPASVLLCGGGTI